jgi:hypothetical protein
MEMMPQIQAYFDAKDGNVDAIDGYFAEDICIEDTGENNVRHWEIPNANPIIPLLAL